MRAALPVALGLLLLVVMGGIGLLKVGYRK
jgi:hypothetical protein